MENLLQSFGLDEKYAVIQADAMQLRCRDCNAIVRADLVDLHDCD